MRKSSLVLNILIWTLACVQKSWIIFIAVTTILITAGLAYDKSVNGGKKR